MIVFHGCSACLNGKVILDSLRICFVTCGSTCVDFIPMVSALERRCTPDSQRPQHSCNRGPVMQSKSMQRTLEQPSFPTTLKEHGPRRCIMRPASSCLQSFRAFSCHRTSPAGSRIPTSPRPQGTKARFVLFPPLSMVMPLFTT